MLALYAEQEKFPRGSFCHLRVHMKRYKRGKYPETPSFLSLLTEVKVNLPKSNNFSFQFKFTTFTSVKSIPSLSLPSPWECLRCQISFYKWQALLIYQDLLPFYQRGKGKGDSFGFKVLKLTIESWGGDEGGP